MARSGDGPRLSEHLHFFGRFLRHPRAVGSLAPSSPSLARAMVSDLAPTTPEHVVELGPGSGAFTRAILERLGPDGRFLAMDIDPTFVAAITRRWPSVDCVCASAETLPELAAARGLLPVDRIISGLPFASLPAHVTSGILDAIVRTLKAGGRFTTFQYAHAYRFPNAVRFRRELSARLGAAPRRHLVMNNVPPAWVVTWRRR